MARASSAEYLRRRHRYAEVAHQLAAVLRELAAGDAGPEAWPKVDAALDAYDAIGREPAPEASSPAPSYIPRT
jgi:hypothetical protein